MSSNLSSPSAEELHNALLLDLDGVTISYEKNPIHIFSSETASYYNCNIINYGKVTLKVCLNTSTKEFDSFQRSINLHKSDHALSVVVEPKFHFQFGEDRVCFVYEQFTPFTLEKETKDGKTYLSAKQLASLKEIMSCLNFLLSKGAHHGRLNDKSVCGVVTCCGKSMLTDLICTEKDIKDDFNDLGLFLENVAISSWGSANIPRDMGFLITQLKNVIFPEPDIYAYYQEHPLFYSGRRKLVLYMFGSTESEVMIALKAKGKLSIDTSGKTHGYFRTREEEAFEQLLQAQLSLLGSLPYVDETGSAGPSTSPSASSPLATQSPTSTSSSTSSALISSPNPPTSSHSTPPSWRKVYYPNREISDVHYNGIFNKNKPVQYVYDKAKDYLRFVRNVYAHLNTLSTLNENQREALFEEVDKMWPGFVFALFATLSHQKLLFND